MTKNGLLHVGDHNSTIYTTSSFGQYKSIVHIGINMYIAMSEVAVVTAHSQDILKIIDSLPKHVIVKGEEN